MMMNNVMGAKTQEELQQEQFIREQEAYQQQQTEQRLFNNNMMNVLQPIDFNDKIMGGNNFDNFMQGKMPVMDNGNDYARRVNILMGNKMQEKQITDNKINAVIGTEKHNDYVMGQTEPIMNKMSAYFDTGNKEHLNFMLGNSTSKDWGNMKMDMLMSNKPLKIPMLNTNTKKMDTIKMGTMNNTKMGTMKMGTMNNSNIMPKFSMPKLDSMNKILGVGNSKMPSNPFSNDKQKNVNKFFKNNMKMNVNMPFMSVKNPAKDITKMFGVFGNPERHARKRIAQQTGLSMFGDYDNDKAPNLVDCDPFDPNRQGGMHKIQQWIYGDKYSKNNTNYAAGEFDTMLGDDTVNGIRTGNYVNTDNTEFVYKIPQLTQSQSSNNVTDLIEERQTIRDEIQRQRSIINNAETSVKAKERARSYIKDLNNRLNTLDKVIADTQKFEVARMEKDTTARIQGDLRDRELAFGREKLEYDFDIAEQKLDTAYALKEKELAARKDISDADRALQREKLAADKELQFAKLKAEQQKGDIAYMQSKLSAGKSLMDGLLGGSGQTNLGAVVGQPTGMGIVEAVKAQSGGAPFGYRVAESVGVQQGIPFSYKVQDSIGVQSSSRPYSETVMQTLGLSKPREPMQEPMQEPVQQPRYVEPQVAQQQVPQPQVAQPRYMEQRMSPPSTGYAQPQYRPQYQQPMYQQPQMGMPVYRDPSELNIDWNEVDPEQVAQIDPEYAEYLKKTEDKKTYRRGPYKTRD